MLRFPYGVGSGSTQFEMTLGFLSQPSTQMKGRCVMTWIQSWTKSISINNFSLTLTVLETSLYTFANSADLDQRAPWGALWSEVYSVCYIWIKDGIYLHNSYRLAVFSKLEKSILIFSALRVKASTYNLFKFQMISSALMSKCSIFHNDYKAFKVIYYTGIKSIFFWKTLGM